MEKDVVVKILPQLSKIFKVNLNRYFLSLPVGDVLNAFHRLSPFSFLAAAHIADHGHPVGAGQAGVKRSTATPKIVPQ
ncbi:MAG: hypothetical protein QME74_04330 [Candidatus Edwardsbacteria bacterium]|nr:hypothetical protein [Candidatus Edwardsbacteria bacterium]